MPSFGQVAVTQFHLADHKHELTSASVLFDLPSLADGRLLCQPHSQVAHSRSSSSKSRRRRRRRRFRFSAAACGAPPRTPPPTPPPPPPPPPPTTPPSPCRSPPPPTSTRSSARCPSPRRSRAEDRSGDRGQCHVFGHSFRFEGVEAHVAEHVLLLTGW